MHNIYFNGKAGKDCNLFVSGEATFDAPEKEVERVSIPGRNGDILISQNRYKNVTVRYPAFIPRGLKANAHALRAWLMSAPLYSQLTDDYHPEYFRLASFLGPMEFDTRFLNFSAEIELSFDAKPQRFRLDGLRGVSFSKAGALFNPERFAALPLITLTGSGAGSLTIGEIPVKVKQLNGSLVLDCETMNAYSGLQNKNMDIEAPEFPALLPGENKIGFSGGIQKVEIVPRWWTI